MNELKTKNDTPAEEARPKQSRWRRLPRGGRAAVVALGIAVLLAVTAFLYVNGKLDLLHYNDGSVSEMGEIGAEEDQDLDGTGLTHTEADMAVPEGSPFADEDVLNILLVGTDERTEAVNDADAFTHLNQLDGTEDTTEFSDDARADSMILVSMDIKDHIIRLVSIERGTGVPILLDGYEDQYDWITHTFRYGGPKLTMKTVEECFNIEVDHFVRVNFNSFVQIVNAVGGVDIDITEMEAKALNWEVPSNSMLIVNHVDPGPNHFDGYTALQYARLRKIDNDWKRVERQRTVIEAVLDQVKNASVMELDNLLNTVLPLIQTNFTKTEIAALLVQLPGFLGCDVQQMSLPLQGTYGVRTGMDNRLMYDPDWVVNIKALQDFLYNDKTAEEVIAATPETAAAEAAGELVIATRETAGADDPVEVYNNRYLHRVDMTYPLDASDFGPDDYRVYLADTDNLRGSELRAALIDRLYSAGVRVLGVPDGAAAGMLLDDYLQTGNAASLSGYLTALPAAERDSARALWQQVRASHPGALHAVGLGADVRRATVARALSVLADNSSKAPEEEIAQAAQAMRSGTPADAVYWFKAAMAQYPRQMERFLGEEYAKATRLYCGLQGTLNISSPEELPLYDAKQLLRSDPEDGILLFTDESSAMQQEGSMAAALQAELDDQPREEDEEPGRVCSIAAVYGTWSNAGSFTPDETETAWDADSLTEYLGSDALRGKDMLLALDGEDSPYLRKRCLLKDADAPVGEQVQKLFVLDKNNMASPETADAE
jgi:LCP family protein required for cell wall assembly